MFQTRKSPISNEFALEGREIRSFRFRRKEHLKRRKEIREVFGKGSRHSCRGAKLFLLKNNLPYNRICFSFAKGFGNAVSRNRARRLSREAFRLMKNRLSNIDAGYDLVFLIYPETGQNPGIPTTLSGRARQLEDLFTKAGLLK